MNLYDMTRDWADVLSMLEDADVDEDAVFDTCAMIEAEIGEKAEAYGKLIVSLEADQAALKREADRLSARAKVAGNRADRLRAMLMDAMKATGQSKLSTQHFAFSVAKAAPSVRITDLELALCSGYIKPPRNVEAELDKAAMKRDLESGVTVPGAELVQTEYLRIK